MLLNRKILTLIYCLQFTIATAQSYAPEYQDKRFKVSTFQPSKAYAFPLSDVKLLPGSPFYSAMKKD